MKQFAGFEPELYGVRFSFGLEVPAELDALIVYTRASYSIPTRLPRERTIFLAAEPDVIHPYSARFLNQFGLVLSATRKPLQTELVRSACSTLWYAGIDFSKRGEDDPFAGLRGLDWFRDLPVPEKREKISIVTSNKTFTPYHRKRLQFIEALQQLIPDRIEMYGRGFRSVGDKADALLPNAYHLAIENGYGPDLWTEKLSDPYLCWAFPFYAGCDNAGDYFPRESLHFVNLDDPAGAAREMVTMMENGHWARALPAIKTAREAVMTTHNAAELFVRLVRKALAMPVAEPSGKARLIRSERSLWPEAGAKGSVAEYLLRNALLTLDHGIELRAASLQRWFEARRSAKRRARIARIEAGRNAG